MNQLSIASTYLETFLLSIHYQGLFGKRLTSFSIVQEIRGKVFLSLTYSFVDFASRNSRFCTKLLHVVFSTLSYERTSCKKLSSEESNFPSLNNFFIWKRGRNLSIKSPVDVAVVNDKLLPRRSSMFTRAFEFQKLCRENLKILLRTSCLIKLILGCF